MRGTETTWVGAWSRRAQHGVGDIADIAVALGLHPGPAFGLVEDEDVVAEQKLRVDAGIRPGRAADIGHCGCDPRGPPGDEALGGDLALQPAHRQDRD